MKVGLVLSGGGARGIAHLGVIKALEEAEINIDFISGSSAGAIVGAMYTYGYQVERILEIVKSIKTFKFLQPALSWTGILKMDVIRKFLELHLKDDFEHLKKPLYIAATNVNTGKTEYFNKGPLLSAICASSCIPVLFDPVLHNNKLYIDGGILNNLPVEPLEGKCDIIIGSHCNPIDHDFDPKNAKLVMERALMLAITCNAYSRRSACDYFIEPKGLESYKVLDLSNIDAIYKIGYECAKEKIEKIKTKLKE
ncbi:patatin-like phospholipase family protein [Fulvivirga maritima]|uniref:patatin-like phospholipase family protein n=1 Tax=Fulvivirga maritima TaxID=2904247 RepID=UPI001F3E083F|nr:patatin-like phospholipase family protein [Fulvivirga maritima]UII25847.1 patatin-like phospholipase family protein [Fulvivirga maritima]